MSMVTSTNFLGAWFCSLKDILLDLDLIFVEWIKFFAGFAGGIIFFFVK
ncbi:1879_t:CDS:2 [Ambispora leptoticha]|uniref:1879_t:CDS:1 n=1 Tax=Ambispora leptoticha TaxID=144679 RepID=A0A9N8Z568_9GLOM|nr:1879_t:CDS:2 [Ambispora leptoticha]